MSIIFRCIGIALILTLSSACNRPSPPAPKPTENRKPVLSEQKNILDENEPLTRIFRQAEKVRDRLRYFPEEIKTTYKPEKQAALLANIYKTVHPAYEEMREIMERSEKFANSDRARDMTEVCAKMDAALKLRDLDRFRSALHDFNPAFEQIRQAVEKK